MNQNQARVISVDAGYVWVEVAPRAAACGNCQSAKRCQTGLLGDGDVLRRFRIENAIDATIGDTVQLHIDEGTLLRASLVSYLLPAILAIGGAALGQFVGADSGAVIGTLAGLVVGFSVLRYVEKRGNSAEPILSIRRSSTL